MRLRKIGPLVGGGFGALGVSFALGTEYERRRTLAALEDRLGTDATVLEAALGPLERRPFSFPFPLIPRAFAAGRTTFLARFLFPVVILLLCVLWFAATAVTPTTAIAAGPARVSQIMKHGFPGLESVRSFDDYVLSYDRRNRVPRWVFEHMTAETVRRNDAVDRSKCDFAPDESVHQYFRAENSDYRGSGYDRGHMAAAGNHRLAQRHVEQTFLLSNMAPQVGRGFNRDSWNRLEKHVRKLTSAYANVYCCTGPLYLPRAEADGKAYVRYRVIGNNSVAVPTHFFKVVVGETADGRYDLECYCMPNQVIPDDTPLGAFMIPLDTIERASGLLFFDKIPKDKFYKINGVKK